MKICRWAAAGLLFVLAGTSIPPAWAIDDIRAAATETMLRKEGLGTLRLGTAEKSVVELLGKPAKQTALVHQEADGTWVQTWTYPARGIELTMSTGEKKTGAKTVATITAQAPCDLATRQGIKIGSPESAVRKAYGSYVSKDEPAERGTLVAGSIYGGIIFNFTKGQVSRIFFGAAAE